MQNLACGSQDLVLSTGERLPVPDVARRFLKTHLWASFARKNTTTEGKYVGGISRCVCMCVCVCMHV